VRDPNAVPDVLQESVAAAFRDFDLYAEGTNFRAWMFRYVHFEILSWNRRYRRDQCEQLPADVAAEQVWEHALDEPLLDVLLSRPSAILERLDDALVAALWELTVVERQVFLLRAIGEFKYREIAELTGVPIGTVMSTLARCRSRLRQSLVVSVGVRELLSRRGASELADPEHERG